MCYLLSHKVADSLVHCHMWVMCWVVMSHMSHTSHSAWLRFQICKKMSRLRAWLADSLVHCHMWVMCWVVMSHMSHTSHSAWLRLQICKKMSRLRAWLRLRSRNHPSLIHCCPFSVFRFERQQKISLYIKASLEKAYFPDLHAKFKLLVGRIGIFTSRVSDRGNRISPVCASVCVCARVCNSALSHYHVMSQNVGIWTKGLYNARRRRCANAETFSLFAMNVCCAYSLHIFSM